ncbi:MAG TPA: CHASE3 domain-containing protein, partial [Roseateles sp.]|nr:CHASE3 domain-containing protein [Roseateles sp.]
MTSFPLAFGLLVAGCIAFVATAYGEHRSLGESVARSAARAQALQTQLQIRKVGGLLVDIETGQRGFIITGQPTFLEPYERALQELKLSYAELKRQLRRDAGGSPPSLERLDGFIERRVQQVERNVEQRWRQGEAVLKDLSAYVSGKLLMDELRHELQLLEVRQERLVEQARRDTEAVQQRTEQLALVLPVVGLLLICGALLALLAERRRRDHAEQALLQSKAALESTVTQRTVALRAALSRIQSFAAELDRGIETERRNLAREVHDQIGQIGTATKMLVLALRKKLAPVREEMLEELLQMADEVIAMARQISAALRPPLLDDLGLAAALAHHAKGL